MSDTAVIVVCPYFGSEHPARLDYIRAHCGDLDGYKRCSLCGMMDAAYYRMPENAVKMPATGTEDRTGKSMEDQRKCNTSKI